MQASFQPVDVIRAMLFAAGVLTAENQCKFRQWFGRRHFILNVKFHSTKCRKSQCRMLCAELSSSLSSQLAFTEECTRSRCRLMGQLCTAVIHTAAEPYLDAIQSDSTDFK